MKILSVLLFVLVATPVVVLSKPGLAKSDRCVIVVPRQGNEMLVNTCQECRMVQVTRARPGGGAQGKRTYAVPPKTKVDLTFHGPGKTRIHTEKGCGVEEEKSGFSNTAGMRDKKLKCVQIALLKNGKPALINSCPACREVEVEYEIRDVGQKQDKKRVNARGIVILDPHPEATDARIRRDKACSRR